MQTIALGKPIGVAEIRAKDVFRFSAAITAEDLVGLASMLGVTKLAKTRFEGEFEVAKNGDVSLIAKVGATATQSCVVTLAPVTTRIDTKIERVFVSINQKPKDEGEIEFTVDDPEDFLPDQFSLLDLLTETLALHIPEYPKSEGAELEETVFTEPGKKPMTDEDARPFAGLAALKSKLEGDGSAS